MQRTVIIAAIALLAGCGSASDETVPTATATATASSGAGSPATIAPAALASLPAGRSEKVSNALFDFAYVYPEAAGAIPGLKALLDRRLEAARRELEKDAKSDQAEAAKNDYPFRKHSSEATWAVVTALPGWLSLSDEGYVYSGGAHGMTFFDSLLWDGEKNVPHEPTELFTSKAALSKAIREPFCTALDAEREKRRGEPVNRDSGDEFDACIDPVENTIILGSSNGRTFDKIGVLVGPYAAGSYAEGTFDLTVPVTPAVLAAVKPAYRGAFSVKG